MKEKKKKIEIDISGQIQQLNYDSALGFKRDNGIEKSVYLRSKIKKGIIPSNIPSNVPSNIPSNIPSNVPSNALFMGNVLGLDFRRNFEGMRDEILGFRDCSAGFDGFGSRLLVLIIGGGNGRKTENSY